MDPMIWYVGGGALAVGLLLGYLVGQSIGRSSPETNRTPASEPVVPKGTPLQLLALLQREGRLLDFLLEDIAPYTDEQVGAAVRDIHRGCRKAIDEHLTLQRILPGEEQTEVTIPAGFNPAEIRLTGNVAGQPPFTGMLQHHGWRVKEIKLPTISAGADAMVVAPAEVQVG